MTNFLSIFSDEESTRKWANETLFLAFILHIMKLRLLEFQPIEIHGCDIQDEYLNKVETKVESDMNSEAWDWKFLYLIPFVEQWSHYKPSFLFERKKLYFTKAYGETVFSFFDTW